MLKIGTRDSALAIWQAEKVKSLLDEIHIDSEFIFIKSKGDLNTETPLHQLGTVGVFTKALDEALLKGEIDIAVHSCKDLPTEEPSGIHYAAYLKRASFEDILVTSRNQAEIPSITTIATGSIRRKAQWLNRYPQHKIENLRGNVNTRLQKIKDNDWFGAVFAKAGLERLGYQKLPHISLNWMIPAPAQGVICIACRKKDKEIIGRLKTISDLHTEITSLVERQLLNVLEGGCSAPIGAHAIINDEKIELRAVLLSADGEKRIFKSKTVNISDWQNLGRDLAKDILKDGGDAIIAELKNA
ncbi:MAG: hydroxymethylbilane synthase [Cytophagales bacterium]